MKQHFVKITFGIVLLLLFAGCATIIKTPRQSINVVSQPSDATVVIFDAEDNFVWSGVTPSVITLNRGNGYFKKAIYKVEISKPGFQKMKLILKPTLNGGWYIAGNLVLGGLIGWLVVDPATGAMWLLNPQNLSVQLSKYNGNQSEGLKVVMIEDVDPALLSSLQKIN